MDNVCGVNETEVTYVSRMVPFKKRCGVKNKNIINLDNRCYCSESNNKGVGKYSICKPCIYDLKLYVLKLQYYSPHGFSFFADIPIWSVLELDNYVWHKNFTYPNTPNYKSLKKEFEKEVSIT